MLGASCKCSDSVLLGRDPPGYVEGEISREKEPQGGVVPGRHACVPLPALGSTTYGCPCLRILDNEANSLPRQRGGNFSCLEKSPKRVFKRTFKLIMNLAPLCRQTKRRYTIIETLTSKINFSDSTFSSTCWIYF